LIRFQREPAGPGVIRVPGGRPVAIFLGVVGFTTTLITIAFSLVPAEDEPHKLFAVAKIVVLTALLLAMGSFVFRWGKRRAEREGDRAHG
jgi:hypothetical protein